MSSTQKLMSQIIDDFSERGVMSEELKNRMSSDKFFKILKDENIYYNI